MRLFSFLILTLSFLISCSEKEQLDIADQHYRNGDYDKAISVYTEYIKMKPSHEIAIYNRGRAYEEMNQYDLAVKDFERVLDINPKSENALLSYGKHFFREKDFDNAAFQFEQAFKLNNSSAVAATLLARAYHRSGQVENAMEYYNIAINNDRNNAEAFMYRGALKIYLNQMSSGCNDVQQARNMGYEPANKLYEQYCN